MQSKEFNIARGRAAGFTLPAVLIVVAALLILAVGLLLLIGIERKTARSYVDRQRAELAALAGLEEVRGLMLGEMANDDYLVIRSELDEEITSGMEKAPHLFVVRGEAADDGGVSYRYVPMFSADGAPDSSSFLMEPDLAGLTSAADDGRHEFSTLPYQDKVRVAWQPVRDGDGKMVARYAFWVEDMQGKLAPEQVGNLKSEDGEHERAVYPFPAPGLNPEESGDDEPPLDQVALYVLDHDANERKQLELAKTVKGNEELLISPGSLLAAAGVEPPLERGSDGRLVDEDARAVEESLAAGVQPYEEQALVPFVDGIDSSLSGTPKLNLNRLLQDDRGDAVDEMAEFIEMGLPDFALRGGGFPDDYLKTLAANALDYADEDSESTQDWTNYRGLDAFPLLSEIALQINYEGIESLGSRKVMKFRFRLFAELFNYTNQDVEGDARLSYEVFLAMDGVGASTGDVSFDSDELLGDSSQSQHDLEKSGDRYWTPEIAVSLKAGEYKSYQFAEAYYTVRVGRSSDYYPGSMVFSLMEDRGASGVSLKWNDQEVDRAESMVRYEGLVVEYDQNGLARDGYGFKVGTKETHTKACLPGHVYDDYWPDMYYNMGDPRITRYLREVPLGENAFPENASPNRRNIRYNIYKDDQSWKPKTYARVLPSEWPDGGHNAPVGSWSMGSSDSTSIADPKFDFDYDEDMATAAPQVISNLGRFYSATELGRVFDPVMYKPKLSTSALTDDLVDWGKIPSETPWPDAAVGRGHPNWGGGNTLRIGRPEHPAFDVVGQPGQHAARLLDLFHAGISRSADEDEREGNLVRIQGHVNVNTASRDALRAMAAGSLQMDPGLSRVRSFDHDSTNMPSVRPLTVVAPEDDIEADRVADAIIRSRPFASPADLAMAEEADGTPVFGNKDVYSNGDVIQWNDSAAEEVFARVYEASTTRSRNFRVWVVGQSVVERTGGEAEVLAEVGRCFSVFADPGERDEDGAINPDHFNINVQSNNEF
ncbi:MAG: hypothetical protein ACQCXQ_07560 [Verrucomicrobiales bacterium]|nr:hypothetical protein [Verrucomicrobiota bacterium JB025]